ATCIADWARFAETVGSCIAFGQRSENNGSVRAAGDQTAPDAYVVVDQSDIDLRIWSGECDANLATALDAAEPVAATGDPDTSSGCSVRPAPNRALGAWLLALLGIGWTLRGWMRR